jgi:hypothetical protein
MERIADPVLRSEYGEHEKRRLEKHMERIERYMRVGSYEQLEKATLIKILEERDSLIETQRQTIEKVSVKYVVFTKTDNCSIYVNTDKISAVGVKDGVTVIYMTGDEIPFKVNESIEYAKKVLGIDPTEQPSE